MWILGAGLIVITSWAIGRVFSGYSPLPSGYQTLHAREVATLCAAADSVFPEGGAIEPSGTQAAVPLTVDRFVTSVPRSVRVLVRLLLALIEHGTLFFPPELPSGLKRFSNLPAGARTRYLNGWQHSRLGVRRLVFTSLRSVLGMAYLSDPAVLRELGLAPLEISRRVVEADLLWPPAGQPRSELRFGPDDLSPEELVTPLDPQGPLHPDYRAPAS